MSLKEMSTYRKTIKMWKEIATSSRLLSKSEVIKESNILFDCFLCEYTKEDGYPRCDQCLIKEWRKERIACVVGGFSDYTAGLKCNRRDFYLRGSRKILHLAVNNYLSYMHKEGKLVLKRRTFRGYRTLF